MAGDSLLDMMVGEHGERSEQAEARQRLNRHQEKEIARQLNERRAQRNAVEEAERRMAVQRTIDRRAHKPTELYGFVVGHRFEMRRCQQPGVDGVWVISHIDPGAEGDASRSLRAQRADGGPGNLQFAYNKLVDSLHFGLLVRLQDPAS